jgi:hypothetical protein
VLNLGERVSIEEVEVSVQNVLVNSESGEMGKEDGHGPMGICAERTEADDRWKRQIFILEKQQYLYGMYMSTNIDQKHCIVPRVTPLRSRHEPPKIRP